MCVLLALGLQSEFKIFWSKSAMITIWQLFKETQRVIASCYSTYKNLFYSFHIEISPTIPTATWLRRGIECVPCFEGAWLKRKCQNTAYKM